MICAVCTMASGATVQARKAYSAGPLASSRTCRPDPVGFWAADFGDHPGERLAEPVPPAAALSVAAADERLDLARQRPSFWADAQLTLELGGRRSRVCVLIRSAIQNHSISGVRMLRSTVPGVTEVCRLHTAYSICAAAPALRSGRTRISGNRTPLATATRPGSPGAPKHSVTAGAPVRPMPIVKPGLGDRIEWSCLVGLFGLLANQNS